jgi:GAF domain-containing protein/HAMP domain-containing protein
MGSLSYYTEALQELPEGTGALDLLLEMQLAHTELRQAVNQVDLLARQENWAEAGVVLEEEVRPANEQMGRLIRQLVRQADQDAETTALRARAVIQQAVVSLAILVVLTTAIALGWRQFVFRGLGLSITELREGVARISRGDLEHRLDVRTGDEIEELADEFDKMAGELAGLIGSLEQRVAERTRDLEARSVQLEAAAQVAREAAEIRDVNQLLEEVVHLISDRFGFYHAGIFLVDEAGDGTGGQYAVLRAASSEGGQRMLERGHQLRVGEVGVVGYAAGRGAPRIAMDVGADVRFFDNPDLPLTRSEIALPLKVRERVIGVLDVQSQVEAAFDEEDVAVLQTLADQVALAIESAHLLEESQRTLHELETLYGRQLREAWQERGTGQTAYRYTRVGVEPVSSTPTSEMKTTQEQRQPAIQQEGDGRRLVASIPLRDQVLGSLVFRQGPEQQPWSPEDMAMVQELTTQVGLALEYARLLEETQRSGARERLVGQVTARMRETLDVDTVLKTAAQEMKQALGLSKMTVRLVSPPDEPHAVA